MRNLGGEPMNRLFVLPQTLIRFKRVKPCVQRAPVSVPKQLRRAEQHTESIALSDSRGRQIPAGFFELVAP